MSLDLEALRNMRLPAPGQRSAAAPPGPTPTWALHTPPRAAVPAAGEWVGAAPPPPPPQPSAARPARLRRLVPAADWRVLLAALLLLAIDALVRSRRPAEEPDDVARLAAAAPRDAEAPPPTPPAADAALVGAGDEASDDAIEAEEVEAAPGAADEVEAVGANEVPLGACAAFGGALEKPVAYAQMAPKGRSSKVPFKTALTNFGATMQRVPCGDAETELPPGVPPHGAAAQRKALVSGKGCSRLMKAWPSPVPMPTYTVQGKRARLDAKSGALEFDVKEEHAEEPPIVGGAEFYVTLETDVSRVACDVADKLDGTYGVRCVPAPGAPALAGRDAVLNVELEWLSFAGFYPQWRQPVRRKLVSDCTLRIPGTPAAASPSAKPCGAAAVTGGSSPGWVREAPGTEWRLAYQGCEVAKFDGARVAKCIDKRNLLLVGPSHLRYMYDGVLELIGARKAKRLPPQHGSDTHSPALRYEKVTFAAKSPATKWTPKEHPSVLPSLPSALQENQVLVAEAGSWDLKYGGLEHAMNGMNALAKKLAALARSAPASARVVFLTTPPMPDTMQHMQRGYRSNQAVRALDELVAPKLREAGVRLVDFAALGRARQEEHVCKGHYLCAGDSSSPLEGDVGWWALHTLLTVACGD